MATAAGSSKIAALWKRGWNEIPEVMGATAMALVGIVAGFYGLHRYYENGENNKRYKFTYTVYRPDDPRVKYIRPSVPETK